MDTDSIYCLENVVSFHFVIKRIFYFAVLLCVQRKSWHLVIVLSNLRKSKPKLLLVQWTQNTHTWHGNHMHTDRYEML